MGPASDTGRLACFLPSLAGGGAERAVVNLLRALAARRRPLDLVLASAEGPFLADLPPGIEVVDLGARRVARAILPLARYLRGRRPAALLSHLNHANLAAVLARAAARTPTRLVLVEHVTLSANRDRRGRDRLVRPLARWLYRSADCLVAVSQGAARDLQRQLHLVEGRVRVIYNGVVDSAMLEAARQPPAHPWFGDGSTDPVLLGVGRLVPEKDFETLVRAFALVRVAHRARLLILGEGECRARLERLVSQLGMESSVSLPGFVANPYAIMSRAAGLILSSRREALPTVVIEALACGCPVVSTDCPSGPREILEDGRFGALVPVGDAPALAQAVRELLETEPDRQRLKLRGRYFSADRAADEYLRAALGEAGG